MSDYKNISKYPKNIPIFPLSGVLLLPKSRLPLNIFEPKYLKMIEDVLATEHRFIGMIQPKSNKKNDISYKFIIYTLIILIIPIFLIYNDILNNVSISITITILRLV